ncbi:BamA/OMP85 family outer membrane protein [Pseudothermotoga thermarum]|uniref:Surface antigen (D15) n=1 Tax=Pseudothermotoga thermarum DSM 5069 TaxID=688269 RepID=F7YU64_9THEM|nr:POTRA domain-containing protein [Pseudothermotoga thermarum]AEH50160.1 surface antigen (D15) [Pseudothermotoga thermarum DSM 5069]
MKRHLTITLCLLLTIVIFGITIGDVRFEGLITIEESYLKQLVSDYLNVELNEKGVQEMLRKIFETGYFSSLTPNLVFNGNFYVLIVKVEENPKISDWRIEIVGPGLIKKKDLEEAVTIEKGKALNINKIRESLEKIKSLYDSEGYFLIEVGGELDKDVYILKIVEHALWEIYFEGETEGIDFSKIRKEMKVDTLKDYYTTPGILRVFLKDIKRCYPKKTTIMEIMSVLSKYVYFAPETSIDFEPMDIPGVKERVVRMRINVVQRKIIDKPKSFEQIRFTGNSQISSLQLLNVTQLKEGETYSNADILKAMQTIVDFYNEKGFAGVSVQAKDLGNILEFEVFEKFVADVRFEGLTLTKPYVIKDLITFEKGEPLTKQDFYDTISALNRTQFFESASVYPVVENDPRSAVVVIDVKEKEKKFNLSGGVAWTPLKDRPWYEGFAGQVSLSTINPFGYGESFSFNGELGFYSTKIDFSFSIRRPFDIPAILDANVVYQRDYGFDSSTVSFDIFKIGGNISTLRLDGHSFGFGPAYEWRTYYPSSGNIQEQTLILSANYSYDTRNNVLFATKGQYLSIGLQKAGLFDPLDDRSYWKATLDARYFIPLFNDNLALGFRVYGTTLLFESYRKENDFKNAGIPDAIYGEYILFYGMNAVRGMGSSKAKAGALASVEIRYDLKSQTVPIYLVGFADVGGTGKSLTDLDINITAGPELDIVVPMFGALGFGVAYHFDGNWTWDNLKTFFRFGSTF